MSSSSRWAHSPDRGRNDILSHRFERVNRIRSGPLKVGWAVSPVRDKPHPCGSPELWPTAKSITYLPRSGYGSAITPGHVSVHCPVPRNAGSPLAGASEPPPRESRATSTTRRAEASASEAKSRPARQAFLGRRPSGLVRMETIVDRGYTRDGSALAPGRLPVVLAADLQGQDAGGEKTDLAGSSGIDIPDCC